MPHAGGFFVSAHAKFAGALNWLPEFPELEKKQTWAEVPTNMSKRKAVYKT